MEGSVEHSHLWQTGHQFANSLHSLEVGGIVQGCKVAALLKYFQHLIGEFNALVKLLASVHHTMAYGINLFEIFDDTNFRVGEQ